MKFEYPSILIIDDTPQSIEVLAEILQIDNYRIHFAMDWKKAREIIQTELPHLILLDIMMPDVDGYTICRELKENPATAAIPVIFVTALGEIADEEKGLLCGAVDYLTKPLQPSIVRARVKTHIDLQMGLKALAKQNELLQENARLREEVEQITQHDLKGPLSAFINIPELFMGDSNLTDDQREMLQTMEQSAKRMLETINRSMDLVKIEMGTYESSPVETELSSCANRILTELESLRSFQKIRIKNLLNGQPSQSINCTAMAEEMLLNTVFSNLLKNALEAAPEGSEVVINYIPGSPVKIEIINEGLIPAEIRDRFFEKYQTRGKKRGTGLGTYSARMMTRAMGGDLTARTEDNKTIITISLPAIKFNSGDTTSRASQILIIDHSNLKQVYLAKLLKIAGQTNIRTCGSIQEGIDLLNSVRFSHLFVDCSLAAAENFKIITHIKHESAWSATKIYLFSSEENPDIRSQALAKGANEFLDPPITFTRLKKLFVKED